MTLQGFPTAITLSGMSLVTTLPAPMVTFEPMLIPGQIITPPPSQTLLPIVTGAANSFPDNLSSGLTGW